MSPEPRFDPARLDTAFALLEASSIGAVAAAVVTANGAVRQLSRGVAHLETGEPLSAQHAFDLASLTKVLVTLPEVLSLIEDGRLSINDRLGLHLPDAGWMQEGAGLGSVTVGQLLTHSAGLPAWMPLYTHPAPRADLIARVLQVSLEAAPGTAVKYSDLGFILLGEVVERLRGTGLEALARRRGWVHFRPQGPAVATERCPWRGRILQGEVHDENASALGGVSGHAGAFGTLEDVVRAAQAWLTDAVSPAMRALMTRPWVSEASGAPRGLGWMLGHPTCSGGELSSPQAFGHTGFTGTSLWVEPTRGYATVLLTNRVHPTRHGGDEIIHLRRRFANAIHAAYRGPA
ncbi:CubicO group peptidase (beta-lactamase class C family) [Deinobacterium chartae]|uniref:CubicO group peptidase (Beta-lactamase class C family) n=1 Tax=Deinobacterium chartae TaxID=521158 RepID=A0A841I3E3_9DEIO|nr:serine hydrolase domain-containing protein [Deinobacterium chartae]MBB6099823.1 CubicO group peptidase (beta-lactamase class C family) [Deinobacterium chartae]